jgi:hypothetical protein
MMTMVIDDHGDDGLVAMMTIVIDGDHRAHGLWR